MLEVGDKIRITSLPVDQHLLPETISVFNRLIAKNKPVVISEILDGNPWYEYRFRENGKIEHHFLAVYENDNNWVKVKSRL